MTENETHDKESARLADEALTAQRLERMQGAVPTNGAQTQSESKRNISAISTAQMEGQPLKITVGTLTLIATPLSRKKQKEYINLVMTKWPNLFRIAASLESAKTSGFDIETLTDFMNWTNTQNFVEEEAARAQQCADLQSALTEDSTQEEKDAAVFVKGTPPDKQTHEEMLAWFKYTEHVHLDECMPAICDTVWILCEGTPAVSWPKTYTDKLTGATDPVTKKGVKAPVLDAPPKGTEWLDDYLESNLRTPQYIDLLRAMNAANGDYTGNLVDRFLQCA